MTVLYLAGLIGDTVLQRVKEAPGYGVISQPLDRNDLRFNIENALAKHRLERKLKTSEVKY